MRTIYRFQRDSERVPTWIRSGDMRVVLKSSVINWRSFCYNMEVIKTTTIVFFITATVMAVTHYLAIELYLYWRYPWFDIPMHFIGGSVVALGYLTARDFIPKLPHRLFAFVPTMIFVFSIALLWELFELVAGITMQNGYVIDTVTDVILGLLGGTVGYFVGSRIKEII